LLFTRSACKSRSLQPLDGRLSIGRIEFVGPIRGIRRQQQKLGVVLDERAARVALQRECVVAPQPVIGARLIVADPLPISSPDSARLA
jgi:hypothetical protein